MGEDHPIHGSLPFTQQYQGCSLPGQSIYLPISFLNPPTSQPRSSNTNTNIGQLIANQWARLRYGIFTDLTENAGDNQSPHVASQQHAQCRGKSSNDVISQHPDFQHGRLLSAVNFTVPRFVLLRQPTPKYVIVLENSASMNLQGDTWEYIRTATKKFIVHDLPEEASVGLVLFNEAAHVASPVAKLNNKSTRENLAYSIRNKYNLSPSTGSCVR